MAKTSKTVYYCKQCGTESPKWVGRCPGCGEWNTMIEEPVAPRGNQRGRLGATSALQYTNVYCH